MTSTLSRYQRDFELLKQRIQNTVTDLSEPLYEWEETCIYGLEWIKFSPELRDDVIEIGNSLYRQFYLCGRLNAVSSLSQRINAPDLVGTDYFEKVGQKSDDKLMFAVEFLDHITLCEVFRRYEEWEKVMQERPADSKQRRDAIMYREWQNKADKSATDTATVIMEVIVNDRLHPNAVHLSRADDAATYDELLAIRSVYLPILILNLGRLYYESRTIDEKYLEGGMELACIIANEEKALYSILLESEKLDEFVSLINRSAVAMLNVANLTKPSETASIWVT